MTRMLLGLCLALTIVSSEVGAEYAIYEPVANDTFAKSWPIVANGATDLGQAVDVDLFDGAANRETAILFVPAANITWNASWNPPPGTGEFATGTGAVVLYKHGESTIRDAVTINIIGI